MSTWRALAVLACAGLMLIVAGQGAAHARTPTPTVTPTTTATPAPTPIAGTLSPDLAYFSITLWVDAQQSGQHVVAEIGDVVCGGETQEPIMPVDSGTISHSVVVKSDAAIPGCGKPGATITFSVDGRKAARTAQWLSGQYQFLTLLVGPPFMRFGGDVTAPQLTGSELLAPYVGDKRCGAGFDIWLGLGPVFGYVVEVYPQELRPGCGVEGAQVTFKLLDADGNVVAVAAETGTWHAWDVTAPTMEHLDLTMAPASGIRLGSMGTGDASGGNGWPAAAVLALAGLTALGAGAALRKRASP